MKVLIDSNALFDLLDSRTPKNRADRMKGLLENTDRAHGKLIIPAQVVGEYIAGAGAAGQPILDRLLKHRRVEIASFDHVAAIECALMDRAALAGGNKRAPLSRDAIWQKVKVDRQIVAIAKVHGVGLVVSSDADISKIAQGVGIRTLAVKDLPLPSWAVQMRIEEVPEITEPLPAITQKPLNVHQTVEASPVRFDSPKEDSVPGSVVARSYLPANAGNREP